MSKSMKTLFLGHFSSSSSSINLATSAAGDLVQGQIIEELSLIVGLENLTAVVMEPNAAWPKGPLFVRSHGNNGYRFVGYLNLPLVKHILFSLRLMLLLISGRPKFIVQYNSYLFENLTILLFSKIFRAITAVFVQDVRVGSGFSKGAQIVDAISHRLIRFYKIVFPVSDFLAKYLNLSMGQYKVFRGALTAPGFDLLNSKFKLENYAVFAGQLNKYNGVDRLLKQWVDSNLAMDLHVFGSGPLIDMVKLFAGKYGNIIYHGQVTAEEVKKWQASAKINFCFRYADGIEEQFFFPSKFFNACAASGVLVVNDFKNIPDFMRNTVGYMADEEFDYTALSSMSDEEIYSCSSCRREYLLKECSWRGILEYIFK